MKRLKALSREQKQKNKIFSRDQWVGQKGAARMRLGALEGKCRKETDALIRENWGGPMIVPAENSPTPGALPDLQRKRTAGFGLSPVPGQMEGL